MNALLKQAKDMFVVLFGAAGLMLVLFPLVIMIVLKRGVLKFWHGLVVKIKNMTHNRFSLTASQLEQTK